MSIPHIDFHLLKSDKNALLDQIRHAVIEFGLFYITNYEEYIDENIIKLLVNQAGEFFKLSQDEKQNLDMINSKHFLGYSRTMKESIDGIVNWKEQIGFCSVESKKEVHSIYDNLIGPSQYPAEEKLPYFKKSIKDFFYNLNEFSILFTELLFEALGVRRTEALKYINFKDKQDQFVNMELIHYPAKSSLKNYECVIHQESDSHEDPGFLTYLFQPTMGEDSLHVQDIFGKWIPVPPKLKTIVMNVGQTLEYLTQGVCISSIIKITASKGSRLCIPYYQNVKLGSTLKPFTMPNELVKQRDQRDKSRKQRCEFQFKPVESEPIRKSLFYSRVKAHRDVSAKWYPALLKELDDEIGTEQEAANLERVHEARFLKLFKAFDNIIHINVSNRTSDIKLHSLRKQVKNLSGINVEVDDFLQLAKVWFDFVSLKLDHDDDWVVDVASTRKILSNYDLGKRSAVFERRLKEWILKNPGKEIPPLDRSQVDSVYLETSPKKKIRPNGPDLYDSPASSPASSPTKGGTPNQSPMKILKTPTDTPTKSETPTSSPFTGIERTPSRYPFRGFERSPSKSSPIKRLSFMDKQKDGPSLLERVKAKEAERLANQVPDEVRYQRYLDSKTPQALTVMTGLKSYKSYSLRTLSGHIMNSLTSGNAISEKESMDLALNLNKRFPDVFKLIKAKDVTVIRWADFDINELQKHIQMQ
jgi:isopenicillin N synthase-like dioxygenase